MSSEVIWIMVSVALAGAVGGAVNALMSDNGFVLPSRVEVADGASVIKPGYLGNMLIGAIAALVSWGLYGSMGSYNLLGPSNANVVPVSLSIASLFGALLIGVGGARWLTNEVDKKLLRAAASEAADKSPSPDASRALSMATPEQAIGIVRRM